MLQSDPDGRPGPAGGAAANGIDDHQYDATSRRQQAVHILRSSRFFDTVSGEVVAHGGDE